MSVEINSPLFITARFRTGSTMLWNIFRQCPEVVAFYEPLHEQLPQLLGSLTMVQRSHRQVNSYFDEYPAVDVLQRHHAAEFGVSKLCLAVADQHPRLKAYIHFLLNTVAPEKTAIFQFNRVDFRLPWLKANFPKAPIIHLYRSAREQWLSSITNNLCFTQNNIDSDPYLITTWSRDLCRQFPFLAGPFIRHAYQRHYYLWKLSYLAGSRTADFSVSYEEIISSSRVVIGKLLEMAGLDRQANIERCLAVVKDRPNDSRKSYREDAWFVEMEDECEAMLSDLDLNQKFGKKSLTEIVSANPLYQELLTDRRVDRWVRRNGQIVIVELKNVLMEKEQIVSEVHSAAEQRLTDAIAKERVIEAQQAELEAKEMVIQQLQAGRGLSIRLWLRYVLWPLVATVSPFLARTLRGLRAELRPKLGSLVHYSPTTLKVPQYYTAAENPVTSSVSISIVTPSFNHARFLEKTILSVLEQQCPSLQYVIKDGASTDDTDSILAKYRSQLTYVESSNDKGQAHAINVGFARTSGDIMGWLNSDDLLLPGSLNYISDYFRQHPEVDVVYGHRVLIDEHSQEIGRWVLPPHDHRILLWADYIPQETLFWRRRIWDKVGGCIDESFQFAIDWELLLRFRQSGARFARLPRFLGAFRVHSEQKTSNRMNGLGAQEMARLRERCHGRAVTQVEIGRHIGPYLAKSILYHKLYRLGVLRY